MKDVAFWVITIIIFWTLLCIYVSHVAQRAFTMGYKKALHDSSLHGISHYEG